jgi:hypothetical protein
MNLLDERIDQFRGTHLSKIAKGGAASVVVRRKQNFLDNLSNSVRLFDYMVKAGQPARPKTKKKAASR